MFRSQAAPAPATVGRMVLAGAMTREMMLGHYEQHLQTATNRNGRPFDAKTIRAYMHAARLLARFLDRQEIEGDLTAACDPRVLNAFLRSYLTGHTQNGTANIQRNLRTLFNWLEVETEIESPYRSRVLDRYRALETKPKTLTHDFIQELLADCKGHGFTAVRDVVADKTPVEGEDAEPLLEHPALSYGWGTKPLPACLSAGLRSTICTSMPKVAPWATTEFLKPWSTSAVRTVLVYAATRSSRAIPAVFSCAEAASTTTATTNPRTSTARHRLRPGTFLPL